MLPAGPISVIFNPAAGRGQAARLLKGICRQLPVPIRHCPTRFAGEAVDLARRAADEGCPVIAAAGGDGTVHETANGILQSERSESAFMVWPLGSANDYAHALGVSRWLRRWKQTPLQLAEVDVGVVRAEGRSRYFVNCLGIGFNGHVTYESRRIRWLRGLPLYGLATLKALWRHFDQPILRVHFDEHIRETPTLALSVNLGQREGNFPVTPGAVLDDGWFDCLQAGPLTRWQALKLLPRLALGKLPANDSRLWMGRCRRATVESATALRIHADGEFFCHPEDGIRNVAIELLPRRLRVYRARSLFS